MLTDLSINDTNKRIAIEIDDIIKVCTLGCVVFLFTKDSEEDAFAYYNSEEEAISANYMILDKSRTLLKLATPKGVDMFSIDCSIIKRMVIDGYCLKLYTDEHEEIVYDSNKEAIEAYDMILNKLNE